MIVDRLVTLGVFSVLAVLALAIYPMIEHVFWITDSVFFFGLPRGLIHWPSVVLTALMFLAYTIAPAVVALVFRLLDRAQGLIPEPVKVVEK